jgi:hypothetical protein
MTTSAYQKNYVPKLSLYIATAKKPEKDETFGSVTDTQHFTRIVFPSIESTFHEWMLSIFVPT